MKSDAVLKVLLWLVPLLVGAGVWLVAQVSLNAFQKAQRARELRARELGDGEKATPTLQRIVCDGKRRATVILRRFLPQAGAWRDRRRCERHAERCARELPDLIDILTLGLQAGLSFDAALSSYIERFDTALARELEHLQLSYQLGMCSRRLAFQQLCDRVPDDAMLRFVAVVSEALVLGTPLLPTFATLGFELRRYQKLKLEERIARAPVKLLVPLGLCVLPAVLILLMGPVLIQMIAGLHL